MRKAGDGQRRAVALDYNMIDHKITVPVHFALLYYFYKRFRLDVGERFNTSRERPVVVASRKEFDAARNHDAIWRCACVSEASDPPRSCQWGCVRTARPSS